MNWKNAFRFLALAVLVTTAMGLTDKSKSNDDDDDEVDWAEVIRFMVDVFNIVFIFYDHCSQGPDECAAFTTFFTITVVVVSIVYCVCVACGVELSDEPKYKERRQYAADAARAATLAHNVNRMWS